MAYTVKGPYSYGPVLLQPYVVTIYMVMPDKVIAYVARAYVDIATCVVMAFVVAALYRYGPNIQGLCRYGPI